MDKFFLGFMLGLFFMGVASDIFFKGSRPFIEGMVYCKDNEQICNSVFEKRLLERKIQKLDQNLSFP